MTDGESQYNTACITYDKLCLERTDPSQWSENIVDATVGITDNNAWTNFYCFLANEGHKYNPNKIRTLGDVLDEGPIEPIESNIRFKTKCVQNGNITHMRVTPDISQYIENGRKKPLDRISETMDEKSPG